MKSRKNSEYRRKQLNLGVFAHVDAGKTTLSEALLFRSGQLRKLGRVDHGDAFLDTDAMERQRGITIFSKQARFEYNGLGVTLVDTPGHVDFSTEAERTLQILDCAILVVSATDGVQSHTDTLWRLLKRYRIPTFIFINKADLQNPGREVLLAEVQTRLDTRCIAFGQPAGTLQEQAALCDEEMLEAYLESGELNDAQISTLVSDRKLFPVFGGSALKVAGVDELLTGLSRYSPEPRYTADFGARVYKISRDAKGARLTWLKLTGGALRVRMPISGGQGEKSWLEKVDQIRLYSGDRFQTVEEIPPGTVCAVTGLSGTYPGQGLGIEESAQPPVLVPVLVYQVNLPDSIQPHTALTAMRQLEEEDPQLQVQWREQSRDIHVRMMGEVQLEILTSLMADRFGIPITFGSPGILYRETISRPVVGVGHFEPLRHYAETHLLLEPLPQGSGLAFESACSTDLLAQNWQRLILTHLAERAHLGVLTGSPIDDMKITLLQGRSHVEHTAGGDFREATYRAVRQGLMEADSILLEPWYDFRLEVPEAQLGRAMSDIRRMNGECGVTDSSGDFAILNGSVPVATLEDYARQVHAYTRGLGRLSLSFKGYLPCHNQEEVVACIGYEPSRDVENPANSVFCSHGVGETVLWQEAKGRMHLTVPSLPGDHRSD